jgi:hypothetical protein
LLKLEDLQEEDFMSMFVAIFEGSFQVSSSRINLIGNAKDEKTQKILQEMILLFNRRFSFKRCYFFFKYFDEILVSKQKPAYRKILYCFKMFFKPNF